MKADLLLKGAEFLEKDALNPHGFKFDLNEWGYCGERGEHSIDCGTAACAMGAFAIAGIFPGLTTDDSEKEFNYIIPVFTEKNGNEEDVRTVGYSAASALFEISWDDAVFLFSPKSYPDETIIQGREGELNVAHRIRSFVKESTR